MITENSPIKFPPPFPPPLPLPPPRLWSALVVPVIAILAAMILASVVQIGLLFGENDFQKAVKPEVVTPTATPAPKSNPNSEITNGPVVMPDIEKRLVESVTKYLVHPYGVAVIVVPGQLALVATALGAAGMSRRRMKDRLGYVRSVLPWWSLPVMMLATLFFGMVGGIIVDLLFPGPHATMQMFAAIAHSGTGAIAVLNIALISLVPGFVEESLFRGYVQRRLLERWTPFAAVAVSSLFFCAAHYDPVHIIAVVPGGVWLGVIAWRSGAVWPGMLCHAAMNATSLTMMRLGADPDDHTISPEMWAALVVGAAAVVIAIFLMQRYPPGRLAAQPADA